MLDASGLMNILDTSSMAGLEIPPALLDMLIKADGMTNLDRADIPVTNYPKWKTERCVHCAAGMPMCARDGYHWTSNPEPPQCTAPTADEYIAELEAKIAELEKPLKFALDGQPDPVLNEHPAAWDLVMTDIKLRDEFGKAKYKVRLQPFNGRDPLTDAYQEALDLVVYLRSALYERDRK
jgi:hypothetical protein